LHQVCSEKETSRNIGTKQLVSFAWQCTCISIVGGQKAPCKGQCYSFGASAIFPRIVTAWLVLVSMTKKCSQRTTSCEHWGSHCKCDDSTDIGIEKRFPEMLSKAVWMLVKVCHCQRELLWRKCCENKCKVTYFCAINQFQELYEATSI
jgi:hypothetical protein